MGKKKYLNIFDHFILFDFILSWKLTYFQQRKNPFIPLPKYSNAFIDFFFNTNISQLKVKHDLSIILFNFPHLRNVKISTTVIQKLYTVIMFFYFDI